MNRMETKETNKKAYRVVQNQGKITFKVEEVWEGGIERGPYGTKEAAIGNEEKIARDNGFIGDLVLQEVVEVKQPIKDRFEKDAKGTWHCKQACSVEIGHKEIIFSKGMEFSKDKPYMGTDVAKWLDENS